MPSRRQKFTIKLDFFKTFEGHNTAEFTFARDLRGPSATNVVW